MIRCQACGTQNLDSSQYCDECGDSLQKYKAPEINESPVAEQNSEEIPVFQSASVTSIGVPSIVEDSFEEETKVNAVSAEVVEGIDERKTSLHSGGQEIGQEIMPINTSPTGVHAKLIIERGQAIGTEFPLASDESYIGRWDADNGVFPDVDLDSHDAEAKVSRKHARILFKNGQYFLEDLGSTNGTFINRGRRLIPGSPHVLNDGDEIIVGKTFLRFQVIQ